MMQLLLASSWNDGSKATQTHNQLAGYVTDVRAASEYFHIQVVGYWLITFAINQFLCRRKSITKKNWGDAFIQHFTPQTNKMYSNIKEKKQPSRHTGESVQHFSLINDLND